jgi:F-type H+-transporting ATPase subunit gamma
MDTLKKIKQRLETISALNTITTVFQEIAHLRMIKIRKEVLKTREFLDELAEIYHLIKKSYLSFFKKNLIKKKRGKEFSFIAKKRGMVAIFLSANEFFYGTLILDIWSRVYNFWKNNKTDLVVIGRVGKYLAESYWLGHKIVYFELNDEKPEEERIKEIIEFVKTYEKIIVFHGKFETILNQNPAITDISGGISPEERTDEIKNYLFEPSPEAVLEFFEAEIVGNLFSQTVLEHSLAKYTARMLAMYQATENIKQSKKELKKNKRKLEWQALDKKQVEIFSGFKLWSLKVKI